MMTPLSVSEGLTPTARLTLYSLRSRPRAPKGRVLLLGGSNFDLRLKRQFLETALAQHYELASFEPRGLGRSDQPEGDWTMQDYAKDALSFLDALGWDRPDIVGESFGGMTALEFARLAPQRANRIALISATAGGKGGSSFDISRFLGLPPEESAQEALCLQDRRNRAVADEDPGTFTPMLAARIAFEKAFYEPSIRSGGYARLLAARSKHDVWDDLPKLDHDITVISGVYDDQAPIEAQRAMADRLPNATQLTYDAGHGLAFSHSDVMPELMERWS